MDLPIGVIIPFYQKRRGLLALAVESVLAQHGVTPSIIIVDDGSPVPARDELATLNAHHRARVTILEQPNAGPGAARNAGLNALSDDIEFVAFLDSDDRWVVDHLQNALAAFRAAADFYFADYVPVGHDTSTFAQCGLTPQAHAALQDGQALYRYTDTLFDALFVKSPVGTSTVVYRRTIAGNVRFRTDFSYGEDVFFWMELAQRSAMIAFSARCEAIYGAGINIAAGAVWGTAQNLRRTYYDFALHQAIAQRFELTAEQVRWNDVWMDELTRSFTASLLHLLRRRIPIDWSVVRHFVRARPKILFDMLTLPLIAKWRRRWSSNPLP